MCKCGKCGLYEMDEEFMSKLNEARYYLNKPIILNSARRCPAHNAAEGGKPTSSHLKGCAVDIHCTDDAYRSQLLHALELADFSRIGIAKTFVHVDADEEKNSNRVWVY